ncbi:TetR/AcrR family transcriptional regulator [Streptomyces sp. NPDC090106]|uniref:TetR/AcrR family transcriptional regulator n=1 Tax=Streptomyces sp. NPDC090106 TaxID=3365946 RepID=UPI003804A30E
MSGSSRGPNDPGRRDRIIEAALDVIAEHGVRGATQRRIADAAGVPLGSVTYHFEGGQELLVEAFTRLAETVSARYREPLEAAETVEEARAAVVEIICGGSVWGSPRELVLSYELYAFASRNPALLDVIRAWMAASRASLSRHFDARTARALDALVEGLSIHNSMDAEPMSRQDVAAVVRAVSS